MKKNTPRRETITISRGLIWSKSGKNGRVFFMHEDLAKVPLSTDYVRITAGV